MEKVKNKPGPKPGSSRKATEAMKFDLIATLRAKGFDPVARLVETHAEAMKQYRKRTGAGGTGFGGVGYLQTAQTAASEICQYVYPKLKNVEMTGANGADFFESFTTNG